MKRKILRIPCELLLNMFAVGLKSMHEVIAGVPADARIVNVHHGWPNDIDILLESEEFEAVPEGHGVPYLSITVRSFAPELTTLGGD